MKRLYTLCLALSTAFCLYGQPILVAPDVTAGQNQFVDVGIKVTGFDSLVTMLFALEWDKEVAELDSIYKFRIPNIDASYFGVSGDSILSFAWDDATLRGVTIHPDTPIFTIRYLVTGDPGTTTELEFRDPPSPGTFIEAVQIIDDQFEEVQVSLDNGRITVDNSSNVSNISPEVYLFSMAPNPASTEVSLSFFTENTETIQIQLLGLDGKTHWTRTNTWSPGSHRMVLAGEVLPQTGMYLLRFTTEKGFFIRKFLVTD